MDNTWGELSQVINDIDNAYFDECIYKIHIYPDFDNGLIHVKIDHKYDDTKWRGD